KKAQVRVADIRIDFDRGGEPPIDGGNGPLAKIGDHVARRVPLDFEEPAFDAASVGEPQRKVAAIRADKSDDERNEHRLLRRLARSRRRGLGYVEAIGFVLRVMESGHGEFGRSRLAVPEHELLKTDPGSIGEALDELLDGSRLAVVTGEIEIHAFAEIYRTKQHAEHADELGAFLVDRCRVEIIDLVIDGGPHRMGERTR